MGSAQHQAAHSCPSMTTRHTLLTSLDKATTVHRHYYYYYIIITKSARTAVTEDKHLERVSKQREKPSEISPYLSPARRVVLGVGRPGTSCVYLPRRSFGGRRQSCGVLRRPVQLSLPPPWSHGHGVVTGSRAGRSDSMEWRAAMGGKCSAPDNEASTYDASAHYWARL